MPSHRPTPGPRVPWETVHEDATLRIATARNLTVLVWTDAPNEMQMRRYHEVGVTQGEKWKRKYTLLNTILRGTPRFSEGVRAEAVAMTKDKRLSGLGVAHLVEAPGLAGVATRAFLSTVALVARTSRTPVRVFGDPERALAWVLEQLARGDEAWTLPQVQGVYDEVVRTRR